MLHFCYIFARYMVNDRAHSRERIHKMSNTKKADPYRRLLKWTIALLVLLALFATAYYLMDAYQKGQRDLEVQRISSENEALVEEYNARLAEQTTSLDTGETKTRPQPKESGWDVLDLSDFPVENPREVPVTRAELLQGGLLLVNRWHEMPGDFTLVEGEMKSVGTETSFRVGVQNASVTMLPAPIAALDEMVKDAKSEGIEHFIVRGGYRDAATQLRFWENEIARHTDRTGEALIEVARKTVSYPGTSDYHTGFSAEIGVYDPNDSALNSTRFQDTAQADWLNEHAWEYGFVFRFPVSGYPENTTVDKSYKTGIDLQINAYRYVGEPHAAVMHHLNLSLEEYIEYLIAHPHLAVYEDGELRYEITRVRGGDEDTQIKVPGKAKDYLASTDNMGGLVVAAIY